MQAIKTKYLPATTYRGSRVRATCERGSVTVQYDDAVSPERAHSNAARALVAKFVKEDQKKRDIPADKNAWTGVYICGSDHKHYYFVRVVLAGKYVFPETAVRQ